VYHDIGAYIQGTHLMGVNIGIDTEVFAMRRDGTALPAAFALRKEHSATPAIWTTAEDERYYGDGCAIEIGFDPSSDPRILRQRLQRALTQVQGHVAFMHGAEAYLSLQPQAPILKSDIDTLDKTWGSDMSLQLFGCNADHNIWGFNTKDRPDPKTTLFRTIGHHFHAEITKEKKTPSFVNDLVSVYDLTVGISSCFDPSPYARLRHLLYGRAGTYRLPPHGVEYRTLPTSVVLCSMDVFELQARIFQAATEYVLTIKDTAEDFGSFDQRRDVVMRTIENDTCPLSFAQKVHTHFCSRIGMESEARDLQELLLTANIHTITQEG
jgi:hypothetical protein